MTASPHLSNVLVTEFEGEGHAGSDCAHGSVVQGDGPTCLELLGRDGALDVCFTGIADFKTGALFDLMGNRKNMSPPEQITTDLAAIIFGLCLPCWKYPGATGQALVKAQTAALKYIEENKDESPQLVAAWQHTQQKALQRIKDSVEKCTCLLTDITSNLDTSKTKQFDLDQLLNIEKQLKVVEGMCEQSLAKPDQ